MDNIFKFKFEVGPETLQAIKDLTEQVSILHSQIAKSRTQKTDGQQDWLTLKEFSKRYKISQNTIYSRVRDGQIERLELGSKSPRFRLRNGDTS